METQQYSRQKKLNRVSQRQVSLLCQRIMPTTSCERGKEREVCGGEVCVCEVAHRYYCYCLPLYVKKREKEGYAVRLNSLSVCGCVDFAMSDVTSVPCGCTHTSTHTSNRILLGEMKSNVFVLLDLKRNMFFLYMYISQMLMQRAEISHCICINKYKYIKLLNAKYSTYAPSHSNDMMSFPWNISGKIETNRKLQEIKLFHLLYLFYLV